MSATSHSDRIVATYHVAASAEPIERRAAALALEQSVELPLAAVRDARVRGTIVGRVEAIAPLPAADDAPGHGGGHRVTLSLAAETVGDEPGQLLNMLFGNCSLQSDVSLLEVSLPPSLRDALPGPRFGIAGLRQCAGVDRRRALSCTALKPQGLAPADLAALAGRFARAGIDVIKDDHGIADQRAAPFAERVAAVQDAVERANAQTGGRTVYAPSVGGGPRALERQLARVHELGVGAVLACPMLLGVPVFASLLRDVAGVPLIAHPAFAGGRIAPPVLLGTLFRLFGADATIFPNFGGRFAFSRDTCLAIARHARAPLGAHPPALPVPAGGMTLERVDEMLATFGPDTMLLIGGNLLEAGDELDARAAAFARRVADWVPGEPSGEPRGRLSDAVRARTHGAR